MKNTVKWVVLGLLLMVIFIMTMMKSPEEITSMLSNVTDQLRTFSAIAHIIFLVVIVTGLILKKVRGVNTDLILYQFHRYNSIPFPPVI